VDERVAFGRQLHRLRKQRDLTQAALAQQVYCAVDTIKKIEGGTRRPSRQLAAQFADCFELADDERAAFLAAARALTADITNPQADQSAPINSDPALRQGNLPAQPTPLLGRARELAQIGALLRRADVRLVTLTGPGGMGKTRLAVQVAAEVYNAFTHGVTFVALAPISDPSLVIATIAQTLGVRETSGQSLQETLQAALRERQQLLVLDNFEQVVVAAPPVAALLAGCPQLKLLVTSRVPLHLRGEKTIAVTPLAFPDLQQLPASHHLTDYAAIDLFVQRVQDVQPSFGVTNENARLIAIICARLDGLPLAIELAAARGKLFPPQALVIRLEHRLTLLTGGARDLPERQQTIRATIDWSYNLLTGDEQTLFARLGVFVGGCSWQAVEAVCNADGGISMAITDGVASLIENSLLQQIDGSILGGYPELRFTFLEVIREYALERLDLSGQADAIRRQHALYFLALAEQAEPKLDGEEAHIWVQALEIEHDNLASALEWSRTTPGSTDLGVRLAGALWPFWIVHGPRSEGYQWIEAALESGGGPAAPRAKALLAAGDLGWMQRVPTWSSALLEESLALYRALEDSAGMAHALGLLGITARELGDYRRADQYIMESLALARTQARPWEIARALLELGRLKYDQGAIEHATAVLDQSLAVFRDTGDQWSSAQALLYLGRAALARGDSKPSSPLLEESLTLFRAMGNFDGVAEVLLALGNVARAHGEDTRATKLYRESLVFNRKHGNNLWISDCLAAVAGVAATQRRSLYAARLFGKAEALRQSLATPLSVLASQTHARDVDSVRAQLGEAAFEAALAAGRALSLEQAIAEALG
jgi:predicted ATPase/transcriptional regulator with XRE-family HTH domain